MVSSELESTRACDGLMSGIKEGREGKEGGWDELVGQLSHYL